jgi:hypothetical protein
MKLHLFLASLLLNCAHLFSEEIDVTQPLRIKKFLSKEDLFTLAIDPYIPENFIAMGKSGTISYYDWVYWGPKKVLDDYFRDEQSLSVPILRVKLTCNIAQKNRGSLDENEFKECAKSLKDSTVNFGKWGSYPFCLISAKDYNGLQQNIAYVGLNDESGSILMFHLIIPQKSNIEASALKLWRNFFKKSKELPEPLFFKAHGQEMHPGYTVLEVAGHKIMAMAEKRKSDHKIQFAFIPLDKNMEFKLKLAFINSMGSKWRNQEPVLKIKGTCIIDNGWLNYENTVTVLLKEVDEFSDVPLFKKHVLKKTMNESLAWEWCRKSLMKNSKDFYFISFLYFKN